VHGPSLNAFLQDPLLEKDVQEQDLYQRQDLPGKKHGPNRFRHQADLSGERTLLSLDPADKPESEREKNTQAEDDPSEPENGMTHGGGGGVAGYAQQALCGQDRRRRADIVLAVMAPQA